MMNRTVDRASENRLSIPCRVNVLYQKAQLDILSTTGQHDSEMAMSEKQ